jgi:TerC family integral membrane protein
MAVSFIAWAALAVGVLVLLLADLFLLHRGTREISIRDAAWSTAGFVAISVAFGAGLLMAEGGDIAAQFFTGYLLEFPLSLDNVFVWALILGTYSVAAAYQHRVLFYGLFAALVLRGAFVLAGSELLARFEWIVYLFGALLIYGGVRLLRRGDERDPAEGFVARGLRRRLPTTNGLSGAHLFVRVRDTPESERPARRPIAGIWYASPLLAVLVVIEATDVIFALDSIPAIFGVTREPFIVFSATALALVGLRSMYFLLAGARDRFVYLDVGLAVILIFVGAKFVLTEVVPIGAGVSLLVIVGVIGAAIAASLLRVRRAPGALARTPRLAPRRRASCRRRTTRRASYR